MTVIFDKDLETFEDESVVIGHYAVNGHFAIEVTTDRGVRGIILTTEEMKELVDSVKPYIEG